MFSVDLLEQSTYHLRAFGLPPGSPMTGSLLESTCSTSELQPVCFDDVANEKCFSPDKNLIDLLANSNCGSTNYWSDSKCHSLQYVFAYKGEGDQVGQGLKAENNTLGGVNWVKNSQIQGNTGKAVFALCAFIVPPTTTTTTTTTTTVITTTTTTTTTTPSSISYDEMEEFLAPTFDCPLEQSEENDKTGATTTTNTLPAIDLLLNPERKTELDQLQRWVDENAENVTLTEVLFSPELDIE